MKFFFLTVLTLFLIIFQSVVLPFFPWYHQCFDLLIMNILFLSLAYSHYAVILTIVGIGAVMDSISGVAFFHHIFSYLWIYLIVQLFKQFVFHRSGVFILIISVVSVLIQQGLILFSVFIEQGKDAILRMDFTVMAWQLFWASLLIPMGVWSINLMNHHWVYLAKRVKRQFAQRYRG
ncbi:MAG: hypothetical protein KJ658_04305 [Proteobacteria bacterium]|nr:hypothetical protein [Desulfobacula sp.]MBU3951337.1 hypothetical protein [Pseudomonadota bacterium]